MATFRYITATILLGTGIAAGFVGGLLGIGGGTVIVPSLVFFLNFNQHKAHGTSLAAVFMVSTAGVAVYYLHGYVEWRLAGVMAIGGVVGAWLGATIAAMINSTVLRRVFCVFLAMVGVRMIVGGFLRGDIGPAAAERVVELTGTFRGILISLGTGLASGCVSGLLGIGGGGISIPAMVLLLGIDQHTAQGISLGAIVPTVVAGMLMHHGMGNVEFRVAKWIGLGAIAGGMAGAGLAGSLSASVLKLVFGIFILATAVLLGMRKQRDQHQETELA
ncbi:MAG: sulfite exporter TauE/SafE family protein [Armatimonadetes bacterium]|nr:sulfite exporter TauE/SafE family protein [Armatimonadota bacterium]